MSDRPTSLAVTPPAARIQGPGPTPPKRPVSARPHPLAGAIVLLATLTLLAFLTACQSAPEPATPPPPTAPAATAETEPTPQATVAAETLSFDGVVDIEVSAESEDALASSATSLEALRESLRQAYSFSQDLTLLLAFDSEGRALLVPADDEATTGLLIRHRDQAGAATIPEATYEVTADGVLFLPIKGGTILMTEASKDGSKVSWGISNQPGVRGGNEIIAYRIEEMNGERVYVITHRVDSTGNWVKLATPERLSQSQTIFAESGKPAEVAEVAAPLDWRQAMSKVTEGYQVESRDGVVHTIPGYDIDHPVIDIVSSKGTRIIVYGQNGYFGSEKPRLVSRTGDNTEMADNVVTWLGLVQKEYNETLGSSEGHTGPFITAIDEGQLRQLTGDEQGPISPDRVLDGGVKLMREVPVAIGDLSEIVLYKGYFPEEGTVAEHNRYVPVTLSNGEVVEVYNMVTYQVNNWGMTRIAFVYPDSENPGKYVLLMIEKDFDPTDYPIFGKIDGIIYGSMPTRYNYFFMPSGKFDGFLNNSLGGRGLPLTAFDEPFKKAWEKTFYVLAMSTEYAQRDPNPLVLEDWRE